MLDFPDWRCCCLDRSAIILAGGYSNKFDCEKGQLQLNGKPLLNHVIDAVEDLVDEVVVVTNSQDCADTYALIVSTKVRFAIDVCDSKGPLVGALSGFEAANGEYSLLLPFDSPFVSRDILTLLFDCGVGKAAAIPRWTNQEIEPLHAVYHTKQALKAAKEALAENQLDLEVMVEKMRGVRFISTMVLEQLDPDLKIFFRINTPMDLKAAAVMGKPRKTSKIKEHRKVKW
jgi:molybdopterin-guanine dinucleotide biosynthesis protein A